MLVNNMINIFSFFFRKPHAAKNLKVNSVSRTQIFKDTNFDELDKRIAITKSEDFYKAHAVNMINPFDQFNR